MTNMPNLVGLFLSATYLTITFEVEIAVGFILIHMCKNVESVCPYSMLAVQIIFAMWKPYIFRDTCQICEQTHREC